MANSTVLSASNLVKTFGSGHTLVRAVDGVSLNITAGELVLVMGPSGSGKTTLLSMIGGLLRPTSGAITIDGVDVTALDESGLPAIRARSIGFIFQAFNLLEALTVEENILFPSRLIKDAIGDAKQRANSLIDRLGLTKRRHNLPRTLSGGEKQRVAIARALINSPAIILADEPTGNLDSVNGQSVIMILHDIARDEGRSVLLVTHDPRVEEVADRILWLEDGQLRDRKSEQHSWVKDVVCGMRVDDGTADIDTMHQGQRYVFCSRRCRERFKTDPKRYVNETASVTAGSGKRGTHE